MIEVIERLIGKGYDLRIFDNNVNLTKLVGTNRDYVLNRIPHLSRLMVDDVTALLAHAQTVVVGGNDPDFRDVLTRLRGDQVLVDLVRVNRSTNHNGSYAGICW
jgi:GDP-mannose 6-dehydrogenase